MRLSFLISAVEIDLKHYYKEWLAHLLQEEEIKWYQRAKTTKLLFVIWQL